MDEPRWIPRCGPGKLLPAFLCIPLNFGNFSGAVNRDGPVLHRKFSHFSRPLFKYKTNYYIQFPSLVPFASATKSWKRLRPPSTCNSPLVFTHLNTAHPGWMPTWLITSFVLLVAVHRNNSHLVTIHSSAFHFVVFLLTSYDASPFSQRRNHSHTLFLGHFWRFCGSTRHGYERFAILTHPSVKHSNFQSMNFLHNYICMLSILLSF